MAAEGHLIPEPALDRDIEYRRWAIGAATLASFTVVLALMGVIFFLFWQRDAVRDITQARSEAEKAADEAAAAVKQSREAVQEAAGMAELARRSLPIIAIGLHSAISRQGWIVQDGQPARRVTQGVAAFASYGLDGYTFVIAEGSRIYMGNSEASTVEEYAVRAPVLSAAYMSDGHQLIITDDSGAVTILESMAGTVLHTFRTGMASISHANVSMDGHWLATVSRDRMIRLWRLPGTLLQKSIGVNNDVTSIAFSNDDSKLLIGFSNGISYLVDTASGRTESIFSGPVVSTQRG
jgi:WD domain, G-beta repeat